MRARAGEIVGREEELEALDRFLDEVLAGDAGLMAIVGEAGIGKSTLAHRASELAGERGFATVRVGASPLGIQQPAGLLGRAVIELGQIETTAPHALGFIEATVADAATLAAQRHLEQIAELVRGRPTMFLFEDVHWADAVSLMAIEHLAVTDHHAPLGVIVTSRPPEHGSAAALLVDHHRRLTLGGLDPMDVVGWVTDRLGRAPDTELMVSVDATAGNPMLLEALIDAAAAPTAPSGDGPIQRLVRALPAEVLDVARIVALTEGTCRVDLLADVLDRHPTDVIAALETAERGGVLVADGTGFTTRHDLHRQVITATLTESAAAALHLLIADALGRWTGRELDIAHHLVLAARPGDRVITDRLAEIASSIVGSRPATALALVERTLPLVDGVGPGLQLTRIGALAACGRPDEADRLGTALLDTHRLDPADESSLRHDLALAAFVTGRAADAATHMHRVVELAATPTAAAAARTELAWAQFLALDLDQATAGADQGAEHGDLATTIAAHSLRGWLALWRADEAQVRATATTLTSRLELGPASEVHVFCPWLTVAALHLELADLAAARRAVARGRDVAAAVGTAWAVPAYDAMAAAIALRTGDLAAARRLAADAVDGTTIVDGFGVELWARSMLATIALATDDPETARGHLDFAELAAADGRAQLGIDHLAIAAGNAAAAAGDHEAAITQLQEGWLLLDGAGIGHVSARVGAALVGELLSSGRRGDAVAVADRVRRHCGASTLPSLRAEAARIDALLDPTLAKVDRAVGVGRANPDALRDVDTLRRTALLAGGRERAEIARRHDDLCRRIGIPTTPVTRRAPRPTIGIAALTPAEARVVELVAEGHTNAEIARRLVVSRRTVDSHVLAAFRKCGVSTRTALALHYVQRP